MQHDQGVCLDPTKHTVETKWELKATVGGTGRG